MDEAKERAGASRSRRRTRGRSNPTMQDVATAAGVSKATVSRVLNATVHVEEATADLVWKAVADLGYQINHVAKSLATGATHTVAVVVHDLANPFYPDFIKGVEAAAHRAGLSVIVSGAATDAGADGTRDGRMIHRQFEMLLSKRIDGFIVYGSIVPRRDLGRILKANIPIVMVERPKPMPRGVRVVDIEFAAGMREAVAHLHSLGHRRIASVQQRGYASWVARDRFEGFREALAEHGLSRRATYVEWVDDVNDVNSGRAAVLRLLERTAECTAVVCHNDMLALGAMQGAHDVGVRVPQDLSVVGIDDIFASSTTIPPLTTLALPRLEIGETALRCLREDAPGRKRTAVQARLVVRGSTGPVASRR